MRIVFLGEDSFSNVVLSALIGRGHEILSVLSPQYDNQQHLRLENTCKKNEIPFLRVKNINAETTFDYLKKLNPDLIVSAHFKKLLKENIISIPKFGCINLHPSLLPFYRGMSPQHWPIINGEKKTGITVHFISIEVDKGDIILQQEIDIDENWYVSDLQKKFIDIYQTIVNDAIDIVSSRSGNYIKQEHLEGSYYGPLKSEHRQINIAGSYKDAYNLIRGVSKPYLGAELDGYVIWNASFADEALLHDEKIKALSKGVHFFGDIRIIKFHDGVLMINKYEQQLLK